MILGAGRERAEDTVDPAVGVMVDHSGNQFFPGPALSLEQHGGIALHNATDRFVNLLHRHTVADELFITAMYRSERGSVLLCHEALRL